MNYQRGTGSLLPQQQVPSGFAATLRELYARRDIRLKAVLRAARDAGWTYDSLAAPLGISRQAVTNHVRSAPEYPGELGVTIPKPRRRTPRRPKPDPLPPDEIARLRAMYDRARCSTGPATDEASRQFSEEVGRLVAQGFSARSLETAIGCGLGTLAHRLKRHGVQPKRVRRSRRRKVVRKLVAADVVSARLAVADGRKLSTVARELGVHRDTVARAVYGVTWAWMTDPAPLTRRQVPARARRNGKLNPEQVATARRLYAGGRVTKRTLAAAYGVGEDTIREAIHGVTWQDVTDPPPVPR